jgi:hypothetical protein
MPAVQSPFAYAGVDMRAQEQAPSIHFLSLACDSFRVRLEYM